ncbi:MAG: M10 family metallopeptidase C-terminal domain-containing protein [Novosphingobium sp.]
MSRALQYLGIDNIRTGANADMLAEGGIVSQLASAGFDFDIVLPGRLAPETTVRALGQFAQSYAGALNAIEGPNEVNNFPFPYRGKVGAAAGVAFFQDALAEIKATPVLAGVAIYDLTGVPQTAKPAGLATDYANFHPYPKMGRQPYNLLARTIEQRAEAGKGLVITETGYHTGSVGAAWEAVDEITQAKLTLNLLADAARLGVAATYLYDLADKPDPTGNSVDANLGLFDQALQPKPVATAIHNLTSILADPPQAGAGDISAPLNYTITGLPRTGASLLLEKAGGEHALLVWAEPDIWNEISNTSIQARASQVQLALGGVFDVNVYDPLVSDQPIASYGSVDVIGIEVVDNPVVVELVAAGSLSVGGGQGGAVPLTLTGDGGTNTLLGMSGDDGLYGLAGNDVLRAGNGDDVLAGGLGADKLSGGIGADLFQFNAVAESTLVRQDEILDFSESSGDKLDLTRIDAVSQVAGNQAFFMGGDVFSGQAGELIQVQDGDGLLLLGDTNGDGMAEFSVMLHGVLQPLSGDAIFH